MPAPEAPRRGAHSGLPQRALTQGNGLLMLAHDPTLQAPITQDAPQTLVIAQGCRQGLGLVETVEDAVELSEGKQDLAEAEVDSEAFGGVRRSWPSVDGARPPTPGQNGPRRRGCRNGRRPCPRRSVSSAAPCPRPRPAGYDAPAGRPARLPAPRRAPPGPRRCGRAAPAAAPARGSRRRPRE